MEMRKMAESNPIETAGKINATAIESIIGKAKNTPVKEATPALQNKPEKIVDLEEEFPNSQGMFLFLKDWVVQNCLQK